MPSGYEKSPDYGSEPPKRRDFAIGFIAFIALPALALWYFGKPPKECWTLGQDEISITEEDGRQRATADLRRIPKGECVKIDTGNSVPIR